AHQTAQAGGQKVNVCRNGSTEFVGMEINKLNKCLKSFGAGEGNRTLVFSLEGCCSTIELHPRWRWPNTAGLRPQPSPTRHFDPVNSQYSRRIGPLTRADSPPILMFPLTTKGGDPVSYLKRCHLA